MSDPLRRLSACLAPPTTNRAGVARSQASSCRRAFLRQRASFLQGASRQWRRASCPRRRQLTTTGASYEPLRFCVMASWRSAALLISAATLLSFDEATAGRFPARPRCNCYIYQQSMDFKAQIVSDGPGSDRSLVRAAAALEFLPTAARAWVVAARARTLCERRAGTLCEAL